MKNKSSSLLYNICVSEFHDVVGKQIICQYPKNVIGDKDFHNLGGFFIPKEDLYGKIIIMEFKNDYYIIGVPVILRNRDGKMIYSRQTYIFNISIMVEKQRYFESRLVFQEMCRKIVYFFTTLEIDSNIIYKQNRDEIMRIIINIFNEINENQECYIHYEDKFLFLKYFEETKKTKQTPPVKEYEVPVALVNLLSEQLIILYMESDINLYKIIKHIDGAKCVKRISIDSEVEMEKVLKYLQNLMFHGFIQMVDLFCFSNRYCLTDEIHRLPSDENLKLECIKYIIKEEFSKSKKELEFNEILKLYLQLRKDQDIGSFFLDKVNEGFKLKQISLIKFIQFGVLNKFIRRAHEYLVYNEKTHNESSLFTEALSKIIVSCENNKNDEKNNEKCKAINQILTDMLKNNSCLDEICVKFQITKDTIKESVKSKKINIICK